MKMYRDYNTSYLYDIYISIFIIFIPSKKYHIINLNKQNFQMFWYDFLFHHQDSIIY